MKTFALKPMAVLLITLGIFITVLGLALLLGPKIPFLGRLPGDIAINRENFHFYFPLASSLVISLILTIVVNLLLRIFGK